MPTAELGHCSLLNKERICEYSRPVGGKQTATGFVPHSSRNHLFQDLLSETIHPDKITPLEKHNLKTDVNAVSHPVLISQSSSVNELPIQ